MKNSIKKVLCTALAAVSLSALVTVPSSLNNQNSNNAIVNVLEVDAKQNVSQKHTLKLIVWDGTVNFELQVSQLNGRIEPDGKTVCKVNKYDSNLRPNLIKFESFLIEKYSDTENRVWGKTKEFYMCTDGVPRQIWLCLYRGNKNSYKEQIKCTTSYYATGLNNYLILGVTNPKYYYEDTNYEYIWCRKLDGHYLVNLH